MTIKPLADNVVMYKDLGAGEIGVSNFVEIAVVARTVYLVCKADVSITFGEYAEEVTGVDLSSAYNVPFKKIPTFYKDYENVGELATAVEGNQNGNADGFVKFINTFIDDTIDDITPMGVFPYAGIGSSDRGFVFRFFSDKHTRSFEIKVCEQSGMHYRSKAGASEWSDWKSVGATSMGVLSKSEDLNNVKSTGFYVLYTEQHPSNTPSGLLSTTTSLLKVTDGGTVLIQEIYPLAGDPYYRLYYKNNFKFCLLMKMMRFDKIFIYF